MLSANEFMGLWFQEGIQCNQKYNASLHSQSNHQSTDKFPFDAMSDYVNRNFNFESYLISILKE